MTRKPFNPDLIKAPPEEQPAGARPLSVSELTAMVKGALARLPASLAVAGEISNFSRSPNGHLYFTLKDESAAVRCVMWRSDAVRLKFAPEDGLAAVAFGQIGVYEPRGEYQLYVARLLPAGRGELELAFRQLCAKLEKLGWFERERKRPIPRIPRTIAVVTSRTGAAIRDILATLSARWPAARVVLADARVQGEGSAESVAAAIELVNRQAAALGGVDVLIVARGGGSLEDLWAFNTELVARAILQSGIPVVSGVGHEIDITIADLVADLRAATPTAAAQAVAPDAREITAQLANAAAVLTRLARHRLAGLAGRLDACVRAEPFRRPGSVLQTRRQLLDELGGRLASRQRDLLHGRARLLGELGQRLTRQHPRVLLVNRWRALERQGGRLRWALGRSSLSAERRLAALAGRLSRQSPRAKLAGQVQAVRRAKLALGKAAAGYLARRSALLAGRRRQLEAFDPRAVLRRGYSMTLLQRTGKLLTRASAAGPGDRLLTELADGRLQSEVIGDQPGGTARRRRDAPANSPQMDLFTDGASDAKEK